MTSFQRGVSKYHFRTTSVEQSTLKSHFRSRSELTSKSLHLDGNTRRTQVQACCQDDKELLRLMLLTVDVQGCIMRSKSDMDPHISRPLVAVMRTERKLRTTSARHMSFSLSCAVSCNLLIGGEVLLTVPGLFQTERSCMLGRSHFRL